MHQEEESYAKGKGNRPEDPLAGIGVAKYIPDAVVGLIVAVAGAVIYYYVESFTTKPIILLGITATLVVSVLVLQIIILRNAARKIIREREAAFAQELRRREEEYQLAISRLHEEHRQVFNKSEEEHQTVLKTLQDDHMQALKRRDREVAQIKARHVKELTGRSTDFHRFLHRSRDLGVIALPSLADLDALASDELLQYHHQRLSQLLDNVRMLFEQMVPKGTTVHAALRCRKSDNNFHTELRTSNYHPDRQSTTEPLSPNSKIVESLIRNADQEVNKRDCVMLTGSRGYDNWQKMTNDKYGQDKSALMGAVFCKRWDGKSFPRPYSLHWILCVTADKEHVFNETHVPFMRCCNDVFSWILNSFVRHPLDSAQTVKALGTLPRAASTPS
jgi:hypothetical protein